VRHPAPSFAQVRSRRVACTLPCVIHRRPAPMLVALFAALVSLGGCKRGAEPVHQDEHHREWNLPPVGPAVKVSLDGKSTDVTLSSLAADGAGSVSFAEVWRAGWPAEDPAPLRFDLVGSDGFRPTSKPKCTRPLTGQELAVARLDVATHDLLLDEGLKLPGCYRVRAVVAIEGKR
jgi:hypothetical protein